MKDESIPNDESTAAVPNLADSLSTSRRKFIAQVGAALAGGAVLSKVPRAAAAPPDVSPYAPALPGTVSDPRVVQSFALRVAAATKEALIPVPPHTTNGDEIRYPDKCGTYTKGILQDGIGLVNPQAYISFRNAIN